MLEIGNGGMSLTECQTHLSLWAMLAAPLLAGNDLRNMSAETRDILTNKEVIAIDQDKLGQQGRRISKKDGAEMWMRPLANGDLAVALFNRAERTVNVQASWSLLGLSGEHKIRDLWAHTDLGSFQDHYSAEVAAHGVAMLRIAR
jgi:alpha-galactosidase